MVKAPLVVPDAAFGEAFLKLLDEAEYPLTVALWLKEHDEWTLILGTPLYDEIGQQQAYIRLRNALSVDGRVPVSDLPVRLEGQSNPLIKELRQIFGKTASVEGTRLGGQRIGGHWIEDGYVYRIK
ncbi:MAG: hypothetical protein ABI824_10365 [Acidobacteriota bacterium]